MKIQPPDDNPKLQRLNKPAELRGAESRPVEELETVQPARKVEERGEPVPRNPSDRRKGNDRRQRQEPVILDTRSGRERRSGPRRAEERQDQRRRGADSKKPGQGIDVKV
jgi:hypothetical protein